jgi:hypothetical protein
MNYTDIIPWIVPALLIWLLVWFRLRKNKNGFKHNFRTGQPVKLQQELRVECFVTKEDFLKANKQLAYSFLNSKWLKIWLGLLVIAVLMNFMLKADYRSLSGADLPYLGLVFFVAMAFFIPYIVKKQVERIYDSTEFLKYPVKYIFNATGYEYTTPVGTATGTWETIQGYSVTDEHLLVYTSITQALFLNNSAFTDADWNTFIEFLEANFEFRKRVG